MKRRLAFFVLFLSFAVAAASGSTVSLPVTLDMGNALHQAVIQKPWPSVDYTFMADPFGDAAMYFARGTDAQAPPSGYQLMRFAVLDFPEVDTFKLSVDQLGEGPVTATAPGGNRSLSMVFGYEDVNNWWVVYYTYTNATRVARIVDGEQVYVCRPLVEGQWWPNNDKYQTAEVSLTREGDEMVIRAYANGDPISVDGCRFPAADYKPGKIGIGGHSTSNVQGWYFKNVTLEQL